MSEIEVVANVLEDVRVVVSPHSLSYSNNSQRKVFVFNWGDASLLLIAEIRGVVNRCEIAIVEPFDVPSFLSVGSEPSYSDVFPILAGFTLQESGTYQQHPLVEFDSIQQVFLKILPGLGCSSGKGIITIDWSDL